MKPGDRIKHKDIQIGDVIHTVEADGGYWYGTVIHIEPFGGVDAVRVKEFTGRVWDGHEIVNGPAGIIFTGDDCKVTLLHR